MAQLDRTCGWRCQTFVSLPAAQSVAQVGILFFFTCILFTFGNEKINLIFLLHKRMIIFRFQINHLPTVIVCVIIFEFWLRTEKINFNPKRVCLLKSLIRSA